MLPVSARGLKTKEMRPNTQLRARHLRMNMMYSKNSACESTSAKSPSGTPPWRRLRGGDCLDRAARCEPATGALGDKPTGALGDKRARDAAQRSNRLRVRISHNLRECPWVQPTACHPTVSANKLPNSWNNNKLAQQLRRPSTQRPTSTNATRPAARPRSQITGNPTPTYIPVIPK